MADTVTLAEAVRELVHDGDTVALEGFTHLIPDAAGHELIRQGLHDLTLVRTTPDVVNEQLIGMGAGLRDAEGSTARRRRRRAFVEQPDVKTSRGDRVRVVVTDLGVLAPRDDTLELVRTHPGVSVDDARAATGWDLAVVHDVGVTEPPTAVELSALQTLETSGRR